MKSIQIKAWERIQHWLRIGRDDVMICHNLARHGVISRYHETRWRKNVECGDKDDDEDGDGRLAWEGILGSIRTDQSLRCTPLDPSKLSSTILFLYQCLLSLLLLVPALSTSVPLWIMLGSRDGTGAITKPQGPTGNNLTLVLVRAILTLDSQCLIQVSASNRRSEGILWGSRPEIHPLLH